MKFPFCGESVRRGSILWLGLFLAAGVVRGGDWPHWRGPQRNDVVNEYSGWNSPSWFESVPRWQVEVGEGSTSPIVVDQRVFVVGWSDGEDHLHCFDSGTGRRLWQASYKCPRYGRHAVGDESAYAGPTSTPEFDAATGYIYTLSCDGDLNCWNTTAAGKRIWGLNLYDLYQVEQRPATKLEPDDLRDYGYTTAPFVWNNWVVVEVGSAEGSVMAFDKQTGQRRWKSQYGGPAGHAGGLTPMTVAGVPCLALMTYDGLLVLRLDRGNEGKIAATYPWKSAFANNVLTPSAAGDCVLISTMHTHKSICKVKITLQGAVKLWEQPYFSSVASPVIDDDRVYLAGERLYCLDWETGKLVWEGGSFGCGGACIATGDNKLIVWSDHGKATLVSAARESSIQYNELCRVSRIVAGDQAWPHPVLANGLLYCKDRSGKLVCLAHAPISR